MFNVLVFFFFFFQERISLCHFRGFKTRCLSGSVGTYATLTESRVPSIRVFECTSAKATHNA